MSGYFRDASDADLSDGLRGFDLAVVQSGGRPTVALRGPAGGVLIAPEAMRTLREMLNRAIDLERALTHDGLTANLTVDHATDYFAGMPATNVQSSEFERPALRLYDPQVEQGDGALQPGLAAVLNAARAPEVIGYTPGAAEQERTVEPKGSTHVVTNYPRPGQPPAMRISHLGTPGVTGIAAVAAAAARARGRHQTT